MLGLAQRSQDELFHIALYNWLIQADLTDKLLEVRGVFCIGVSKSLYILLCLFHQTVQVPPNFLNSLASSHLLARSPLGPLITQRYQPGKWGQACVSSNI